MRNPLVAPLVLLVAPVAWAAPQGGGQRPEVPAATGLDPGSDPLSPELPALPVLRGAVRSLGPPERDVEAMTREQALLYLFVLHDHDRNGRLDGLELLQLLGTALAQRDGGRPGPEAVAALVDRVLQTQDLSGDGLLDPPELLLPPGRGPPGQPPMEPLPEPEAVPGGDTEMPGGAIGDGPAKGQAAPQDEAPQDEAPQDEAPQDEAPQDGAVEAEEAPEAGTLEEGAAPVWGDAGEG
ncbi:cell growth regulator with EF hand domain protein 1 [Aegotheles albertisi]